MGTRLAHALPPRQMHSSKCNTKAENNIAYISIAYISIANTLEKADSAKYLAGSKLKMLLK
jgi:hypothetical protein